MFLSTGIICATILNLFRDKNKEPIYPSDFIPPEPTEKSLGIEVEQKTSEEITQQVIQAFSMFIKKD